MEPSTLSLFISAFLEKGLLFLILAVAVYIFYKKDETRRTNDLLEREAMRIKLDAQELRIENYLKNDSSVLQELVRTNIATAEKQTTMMSKTNEVMGCIIKEIQEFKKSAIFKHHEENKSKN